MVRGERTRRARRARVQPSELSANRILPSVNSTVPHQLLLEMKIEICHTVKKLRAPEDRRTKSLQGESSLHLPSPAPSRGAPLSSDSDAGQLHGAAELWETAGAGALVRTVFAFTSIAFVHLFLACYLALGPHGVFFMKTLIGMDLFGLAFWFTTTCFLLTYTSMARY